MAFEIIVCVSAYYICNQKTRFFEDVSTAPTVVLVESACFHTQQYRHCPFCRLRLVSQSSPRVPCTRLGQSPVYKARTVFSGFPKQLSFTSLVVLHKDPFVR